MVKSSDCVVITGCSRGIGLELATQYAKAGWQVIATARQPEKSEVLLALEAAYEQVTVYPLDVCDDQSIAAFVVLLKGQAIDLLVNNAGVYGAASEIGHLGRKQWREVLETNTISPLMLAQALLPNLALGRHKVIAMVSSKVGSVADNQSGGSYYYRSSKTALNQAMKSLSIDLAPKGIKVVALHPGWVMTDMGGPNALIDVQQSVAGLRKVLMALDESKSGLFYSYDGSEIPW